MRSEEKIEEACEVLVMSVLHVARLSKISVWVILGGHASWLHPIKADRARRVLALDLEQSQARVEKARVLDIVRYSPKQDRKCRAMEACGVANTE